MEKQLGQESIDALFAAAQAATGEAVSVSRLNAIGEPEPYNFSRAGQISNEQMRAISTCERPVREEPDACAWCLA